MNVEIGNRSIPWWKIRIPKLLKVEDLQGITEGDIQVIRDQLMRLGLKPRLEQLLKELVVSEGGKLHVVDAQKAAMIWLYLDPSALRRLHLLPNDATEPYDDRFIPPEEVANMLLAMYDYESRFLSEGRFPSGYLFFLGAQRAKIRASYWKVLGDARKITLVADYLATSNSRLNLEDQFGDFIKDEPIEFIASIFDLIIDGQKNIGGVAIKLREFSWLFFDIFCRHKAEELLPLARKIAAVWPQKDTPWIQATQVRQDIVSVSCGVDCSSNLIRCLMMNGYNRLLYDQEKGGELLHKLYQEGQLSFRTAYAALRDTGTDGFEMAHRFCLDCLVLEGENREERQATMLKEAVLIDCELSNPTAAEYRNLAWASQLLFRALAVEYLPGRLVSTVAIKEAVRGVINAYDESSLEFQLVGEFIHGLSSDAMRELSKQAVALAPYEFQDCIGEMIMAQK